MLDIYLGIALVLTFISAVLIFIAIFNWSVHRTDHRHSPKKIKKSARLLLLAMTSPLAAWAWPLTIPAGLVYFVLRVAKDASLPTD